LSHEALDAMNASTNATCRNCQTPLQGGYCHRCGQKDITDQDRRFSHLISLFFTELTSLDGKFWRTLRGLLRPGFLAKEYLQGRRSPYLTPVSVFLLVNVLYFIYPALTDFDLPFSDQVAGPIAVRLDRYKNLSDEQKQRVMASEGQMHSPWTSSWVKQRLKSRQSENPNYRVQNMADAFDQKSADVSKLLIMLHVPFLSLVLMLLFWKTRLYYAEHFVAALVLFATLLLFIQVVVLTIELLPVENVLSKPIRIAFLISAIGVVAMGLRTIYRASWWYCLPAAFLFLFALLMINVSVYRALQFVLVFALI
jgi:hypothetical protein